MFYMAHKKQYCKKCNKLCMSEEKQPLCVNCIRVDHLKNSKRKCHHCGLYVISNKQRWGKLCFECNSNPKINIFYVHVPTDIEDEIEEEGMEFPLPSTATQAAPGTEEKIKVFIQRANSKVQLFHPQDKMEVDCENQSIQKILRRYKSNDNKHRQCNNGSRSPRIAENLRNRKKQFHCEIESIYHEG